MHMLTRSRRRLLQQSLDERSIDYRTERSSTRTKEDRRCWLVKCVVADSSPQHVPLVSESEERDVRAQQEWAARVLQSALRSKGVDPITMDPVRKAFYLHRNGAMIVYRASTLFEYVSASGDLYDPVARQQYANHELTRLEREVGKKLVSRSELRTRSQEETQRSAMLEWLLADAFQALRSQDSAPFAQALQDASALFRSREEGRWFLDRISAAVDDSFARETLPADFRVLVGVNERGALRA